MTKTVWFKINGDEMMRETYLSLRKSLIDSSIEYTHYVVKPPYSYIRIKMKKYHWEHFKKNLHELFYYCSAISLLKNKPSNVSDCDIIEHFEKE